MNTAQILSSLQLGLLALSSLFFLVDPIATIPVFLYMTSDAGPGERSRMARSAALTCFFVLAGFSMVGMVLFRLLGITLAAFQTAGGDYFVAGGSRYGASAQIGYEGSSGRSGGGRRQERCRNRSARNADAGRAGRYLECCCAGRAGIALVGNCDGLCGYRPDCARELFSSGRRGSRQKTHERNGNSHPDPHMGMLITALAVQFIATGVKALGLIAGFAMRPTSLLKTKKPGRFGKPDRAFLF